jgi:hypothetical protein
VIVPDVAVIDFCVDAIAGDVAAVGAHIANVADGAIHSDVMDIARYLAIIVTDVTPVTDDFAAVRQDISSVLSYVLRNRTLVHMYRAPRITSGGALRHTLCTGSHCGYR